MMNLQSPYKQVRKKIEFEVFGQFHTAYCGMEIPDALIEWAVRIISETASIRTIHTDLIDDITFQNQDLNNIVEWHNRIQEYKECVSDLTIEEFKNLGDDDIQLYKNSRNKAIGINEISIL